MRWRGGRRSSNIEDRRGQGAGPKLLGGGVGTIVLVLVAMYFGVDPTPLLDGMQSGGHATTTGTRPSEEDLKNDPLADMVDQFAKGVLGGFLGLIPDRGADEGEFRLDRRRLGQGGRNRRPRQRTHVRVAVVIGHQYLGDRRQGPIHIGP